MLTDAQARKAKAAVKDYKLADAGGLYLFVTAKGYRSWRLKYRYAGREKRLVFGPYPEVSLLEARDKRDAARRQLRELSLGRLVHFQMTRTLVLLSEIQMIPSLW